MDASGIRIAALGTALALAGCAGTSQHLAVSHRHTPAADARIVVLPTELPPGAKLPPETGRTVSRLYATELLLRSREQVAFVTGRRSAAGDPQLPSRIVFHCPEDQVVERVKRFVAGGTPSAPQVTTAAPPARSLPRLDALPEINRPLPVVGDSVEDFSMLTVRGDLFRLSEHFGKITLAKLYNPT